MKTTITESPVTDLSSMSRQELEKAYIDLKVRLTAAEAKNDWYYQQYLLSKQKQFGISSEKATNIDGQLELPLFNEAEAFREMINEEPKLTEEDNSSSDKKAKRTGKKAKTKVLPEVIEETFRLTPEEAVCPQCGGALHEIKEEYRTYLEVEPAKVYVHKYPSMTYGCRKCEKDKEAGKAKQAIIIKAPGAPEPLIKGSMVSPSLIAYIIIEKFIKAVPFYRLEQELKRQHIPITRVNMCNWLIRLTNDWLQLIFDRMEEIFKQKKAVHCDETEVEVLAEPDRPATTKSRVWVMTTMEREKETPMALYHYTETRSSAEAYKLLKGFEGYIHCDDYAGYDALLNDNNGCPAMNVTLVTCLVHITRYFKDVLKAVEKEDYRYTTAAEGIEILQKAFAIDNKFNDLPDDKRKEMRQTYLKPVLDEFFAWNDKQKPFVLPKCTFGKAVKHADKAKEKIYNVLLDGICELDNSMAERQVKPFVIGRKNWLFSNTPQGARSSCIAYSIVETAKLNNLVPFEYIKYLFEKMPEINVCNIEELDQLLPWSKVLPAKCYAPSKS